MDQIRYSYSIFDLSKKITILLSNYIKDPQYKKTRKQDAFILVQKFGKLIFLIIFTCNLT